MELKYTLVVLLASCLGSLALPRPEDATHEQLKHGHSHKFGQVDLDILRYLVDSDHEGPVGFSPQGVRTMLAMLHAGSQDLTKMHLKEVLGDDRSARLVLTGAPVDGRHIGNAVRISKDLVVQKEYKNALINKFNASFELVDFTEPEKVIDNVNAWTRGVTHDKLKRVIGSRLLAENPNFLMVNVVDLDVQWDAAFAPSTEDGVFYESSGDGLTAKMAPVMHKKRILRLGHDCHLKARVLEIPLARPANHALYVVLPDKVDGLSTVLQKMIPMSLGRLFNTLSEHQMVSLNLPKFKFNTERKLHTLLPNATRVKIFGAHSKFTELLPAVNGARLNNLIHKSVLEVSEGSDFNPEEQTTEPTAIFNATHPFAFFVAKSAFTVGVNPACGSQNVEALLMGAVTRLENAKPLPATWGSIEAKEDYHGSCPRLSQANKKQASEM